ARARRNSSRRTSPPGRRSPTSTPPNAAPSSTSPMTTTRPATTAHEPSCVSDHGQMSDPSIARHVVEGLRAVGIDTLFCLPGVQNDDFFDVLVDAGDIRPIVARHEQGAAYMAMGASQVHGRPAAFSV